jgi:tetratricopeptide (TPR) repeat protein
MKIIHKIDDFLYNLFPSVDKNDTQSLMETLKDYYAWGPYKPAVSVSGSYVTIMLDVPAILAQQGDFKKVVQLCEKGNYAEAKPILRLLIAQNPSVSEYHRVMGQVLSEEGHQDEAINSLIDALRWDSKNGWALMMMGNIFSRYKKDITTALKYYDQALVANPDDYITLTNIGVNLMQQGNLVEAKRYLEKSLKINDKYPNTYLALGMTTMKEGDDHTAFQHTVQAVKLCTDRSTLYQNAVRQAIELAKSIAEHETSDTLYKNYLHKLEFEGERKIQITADEEIPTAARFEFAENYNRDKHVIRYKLDFPAVQHLIMHELVHVDLVTQARKESVNQLFISHLDHRTQFVKGIDATIRKLSGMGVSESAIQDYCSGLFEGLNRQVFNTPIDLFIEQYLYQEHPSLRPIQFLSLYRILQEGLKATTDKDIVALSPKNILSKSKIYNIVLALQYKDLYGVDLVPDFLADAQELAAAKGFYEEYLEYRDDRTAGEEYELVLHWAEDLKLDQYFELVDEVEFRTKRTPIDNLMTSIEEDPYDLESDDKMKRREMEKFQKSQKALGTNMAVVMYMAEALRFFEHRPKEETKRIAIEISMQGTQGYKFEVENYRLSTIPGRTFTGYQILAYYYVSWAIAMPDMLAQLQIPYEEEYKLAQTLYKFDN